MEDRAGDFEKIRKEKIETVLNAIEIIKKGRVFDLGMEINKDIPEFIQKGVNPFKMEYEVTPDRNMISSEGTGKESRVTFAAEVITGSTHISTHIDALCHISFNNEIFGNHNNKDVWTKSGYIESGAEKIPPIIGRGELLDIAKYLEVEKLADDHVISLKEIKTYLKINRIDIEFGDTVCLRTGKIKDFYNKDYHDKGPGISIAAANLLYKKGMRVLCSDYASIDPVPLSNYDNSVHLNMLYRKGVYIIEGIYLEELSKENILVFFMICSPLKFTGCSGSWVRPVALI